MVKYTTGGRIHHMDGMSESGKMGIGESDVFLDFQERLSRVAGVDRPVLIIGERGSGKELAVRRIHYLSRRWQNNLVAVNCASLPASLIESELFGYEQGAFTGAVKARKGRLRAVLKRRREEPSFWMKSGFFLLRCRRRSCASSNTGHMSVSARL